MSRIPDPLHVSNTQRARTSTTVNITELTVGHGWLTAEYDYEARIVSTAVLNVSLHESLYSTDRQLVNPSAHPDDDGRQEPPALVWCDTWGVQAVTTHSDSRDNQTGYFSLDS
jgi:hypothetical protein